MDFQALSIVDMFVSKGKGSDFDRGSSRMITKQKIRNFFEAGMIADALGVPVEFNQRDTYTVSTMQGYGTYNQPAGSWSDDSSLTLCLAETLAEKGDADACMTKFVDYLEHGSYTPSGKLFDIGNATREAIFNFEIKSTSAIEAGSRSPSANGNGALMRIAPLAFACLKCARPERQRQICEFTTITHGHIRSIIANDLYVECLRAMLLGMPLIEAMAEAWDVIEVAGYPQKELALFKNIHDTTFAITPRQNIRSSGYVIDSFEAAMWCALNEQTLRGVCLLAVNLGEDTDTIAQIAASLYAAGHLDEQAPPPWRYVLIHTRQEERIVETFAEKFCDE